MGLITELPETLTEVDVIIVGGGTAGCVVAARLADADPDLEILVVERGPNNQLPIVEHPGAFFSHLAPDSKTAHFNVSNSSPHVGGRTLVVPTGSVLGGGSSINFMMYSRAQKRDFDAWNTPGWSADDLLPYIKKAETYHSQYIHGNQGPVHISRKNFDELLSDARELQNSEQLADKYTVAHSKKASDENHGTDGPVHVSRGTYGAPKMQAEYIAAAEKFGWREVPDRSDVNSVNAVWRANRFISPEGKRQDAASCYIHPRLKDGKHPNLHVLVETQVVRVLFDHSNKRAVGIEFRRNPQFDPDSSGKLLRSIKARKMVVLACGTCATPTVLERSGIGQNQILDRAGVPVIVDLPGVGKHYEDHHMFLYAYKSSFTADDTGDAFMHGKLGSMEDLMKDNHKILGWNMQEIQGKVRPTENEVDLLGPEFRKVWDAEFKHHPDKPLAVMALAAGNPIPPLSTGEPCIGLATFTVYPFSRGHVHITGSAPDDVIDFDTGFFGGENGHLDVKKHVYVYKKQREVIRRMPSYRGEVSATHPPFASTSPAACQSITEELPGDIQDIVYSAEDDAVLEKWIRENVGTTWHSLGTCKMQPRENGGVVDANLSVYGVEGLKVADLSIAPGNVAANTNATALMIGEKAADIFIKELGLVSA